MSTAATKHRKRLEAAAADPAILFVPVALVKKRYRLRFVSAREAVRLAEERARSTGRWKQVVRDRRKDDLLTEARTVEKRYPGILLRCCSRAPFKLIASKFTSAKTKKKLSWQRVQQVSNNLRELAKLLGTSPAKVAGLAQRGKLPPTNRSLFDVP